MTPSALDRVRTLRGVTWEWRPGTEAIHGSTRTRQMGVIAQDVAKAFPEAVVVDEPSGILMVDYAGLVGALIEAVKELADRVEELERPERGRESRTGLTPARHRSACTFTPFRAITYK